MLSILEIIFEPLTNLLAKVSVGYLLYAIIISILLLCLMVVSLIIKMIYLFSYEFPNYLLFGSIINNEVIGERLINIGSVWYQFLIVSLVIWMIMLILTILRFTLSGAEKGHNIMKAALITALKGIGLLFVIQGAIFALNFVILRITGLLLGSQDYSGMFVNNFLQAFLANDNFNKGEIAKAIGNADYSSLGAYFSWNVYSNYFDSVGLIGLLVSGILGAALIVMIAKIMISVIFDVITKLFQMMVLFIFFPFIVPWSMSDGGKKIAIWKDEYLGSLLSLSVYLIGLRLMFIFIGAGNTFLSNFKRDDSNIILINTNNFTQLAGVFIKTIFMTGAVYAYKTISSMVIKYIGTELNTRTFNAQNFKQGLRNISNKAQGASQGYKEGKIKANEAKAALRAQGRNMLAAGGNNTKTLAKAERLINGKHRWVDFKNIGSNVVKGMFTGGKK